MIGSSPSLGDTRVLYDEAHRGREDNCTAAPTNAPILIRGESGTGKDKWRGLHMGRIVKQD